MTHPFELTAVQLQDRLDEMVEVTFGDLQSQFLTLVAWHLFGADVDFRTTATRADHLRGLCDGWETRGAADRDEHAWVAANRAEARALAMHEASTGLAGLVDLGFAA